MSHGKTGYRKRAKRALLGGALGGAVLVAIILVANHAQSPNRAAVGGGIQEKGLFAGTSPERANTGRQDSIPRNSGRSRVANDVSATEEKEKSVPSAVFSLRSSILELNSAFITRHGLDDRQVHETVDYLNQLRTECQDSAALRIVRKTERDKPEMGIFRYAIEHDETLANERTASMEATLGQIAGGNFAEELGKAVAARMDFLGLGGYDIEISVRVGKQRDNGGIVRNAAQMFYYIPGTRKCVGLFNTSLVGLTNSTRLFELDPDIIMLDDPQTN